MTYHYLNFFRKGPKGPDRTWRRAFSSHALAVQYMVTLEPFEEDTFATVTEEAQSISRRKARIEAADHDDLFTQGG